VSPEDPRHGTPRGFHAHRRDGEKPCEDCREAVNAYERRRRKSRTLYQTTWEIPALGSMRRLRALHWMGWRGCDIGARIGVDQTRISQIAVGKQTHVLRRTAADIDRVYRELCMRPGPSQLTRKRAIAAGWVGCLAWDDIDHDEAPVGVAPDGDDRLSRLLDLDDQRATLDEVAEALGISKKAVWKWCRRNDELDLYDRIARRTRVGTNQYAEPGAGNVRAGHVTRSVA